MDFNSKAQLEAENIAENVAKLNIGSEESKGAAELVQQCQTLLEEMDTFEAYLESHGQAVELRHFRGSVKTECKLLEKVFFYLLFFVYILF